MSDEDSIERRQEEARMRELLQVAMGPDDIPQSLHLQDEEHGGGKKKKKEHEAKELFQDISDHKDGEDHPVDLLDVNDEADAQMLAVNIGGPKPTKPVKPAGRHVLHNQLTESISSSRDARLSEQEVTMLFGSKRTSYTGTFTDLSDRSSLRPGELDEYTKKSRKRVAQYDLTTAVFVLFSVAGAVALVISLTTSSSPVQAGLQLPQQGVGAGGSIAVGSASSGECGDIMTVLDESIYVNSTALEDEESPQHRAYHWICNHDTAELDINDPAFVTRYALAVFFYATSGRPPMETAADKTDWTDHANWLTEADYCSWFGITCVDEENNLGEILQIELSQNFLSGRLPGELSAIVDALGIKLDSNFLYGPIPTQFGRMSNLQDLWLSDNKLDGIIPIELGNMAELRELTLAANDLTGEIPETLSEATHIHYLAVEDNHLKGTIPAILFRSLTGLKTFHVSNNELTGSIPDEVYDMTSLATIRLSENDLSGSISEKLGQLVNLESLHLTDNHFTGELPDVFEGMELLTECKLGQNDFTGGVPASLGEALALIQLTFEGNELTGEVPEGICALTETGSLEMLTADCFTEIEGSKGTLDLSSIEGAQIIDSGSLGGLTDEEEEVVELEGLICDCCTECF